MNYLIVGAGNAGRPVARFLNFKENNVTITDPKEFEEFRYDVQIILLKMEKEGVKLDLGNKNPSLDGFEKVYKAPSLPESAPIAVKIKEEGIPVLTNEEFSKMAKSIYRKDMSKEDQKNLADIARNNIITMYNNNKAQIS